MKNSAINYPNANRENVNVKRRQKYFKDRFLKKGFPRVEIFLKLAKTRTILCLCCL